jgi:hypothetical protein
MGTCKLPVCTLPSGPNSAQPNGSDAPVVLPEVLRLPVLSVDDELVQPTADTATKETRREATQLLRMRRG